jgi:hypothetical protein
MPNMCLYLHAILIISKVHTIVHYMKYIVLQEQIMYFYFKKNLKLHDHTKICVCAQSFRNFWWQANQSGLLQKNYINLKKKQKKTQINKLWDVPKLIRLINMTIDIEVPVKF